LLATILFSDVPRVAFDLAKAPAAPDYAQAVAWGATPDKPGATATAPAGVIPVDSREARVDVFFVHPTSFFESEQWNQPLDHAETNERTDMGSLRAQASVFNGCCRIYAPRYRQMTVGAFMNWSDDSAHALDLAYSDVKRAFQYYLDHYNRGRPFIIASHSQGSRHVVRLIPEMIDGRPLMNQFVAGYIIGNWLPESWFARMKQIKPCASATATGCIVTWSTLLEGADAQKHRVAFVERTGQPASMADQPFVCTNPLSWSTGPALAPASLDIGGWIHGPGDKPRPPDPHLVSARCENGALFVSDPGADYRRGALPGGNYHNLDYQLAYMNVRENAIVRAKAFLASRH
jgi:hypothetical protein